MPIFWYIFFITESLPSPFLHLGTLKFTINDNISWWPFDLSGVTLFVKV